MRFLVDAQLPPALARWLDARGHSAQHVNDIGMEAAPDAAIWAQAAQDHAVIITKDEDFALLRTSKKGASPAVVWLRLGNTRRVELLRWIEHVLPMIIQQLEAGETLIEVR